MTKYKWNKNNKFFLTRDGDIEILHSDDRWEWELFHFVDQQHGVRMEDEELDMFGRNYTDKLFIRLCYVVHGYVIFTLKRSNPFQSLSCKKVGDQYIARLVLSNETLEMELSEMVALLEKRMKEKS